MKFFILSFLFTLLSSSAQASPRLFQNIADSIDSLLSDTVNEGDMQAQVLLRRGKPAMSCQLAKHRDPLKGIAKCDVTFAIESNYTEETQKCEQMCFLIQIYDLKTLKIVSRVESLEQTCIENLSTGCD